VALVAKAYGSGDGREVRTSLFQERLGHLNSGIYYKLVNGPVDAVLKKLSK
jgi:hypothetical protein